ncbi:MAG: helix-turn-helix domain-containing protein [Candidatus Paracaedibacteraceae bacterium]|nr:helix-turn-helix domain-containing protein [Candidatus Paracaedibacteraceae bacterium]
MNSKLSSIEAHIGQQLKKRREELNLTQHDLASSLKITPQQLSKYEIGTNQITAKRFYHLCKVLNVSPNFFFEGLEEMAISFPDQSIWLSCHTLQGQKIQIELSDVQATVSDIKILSEH